MPDCGDRRVVGAHYSLQQSLISRKDRYSGDININNVLFDCTCMSDRRCNNVTSSGLRWCTVTIAVLIAT